MGTKKITATVFSTCALTAINQFIFIFLNRKIIDYEAKALQGPNPLFVNSIYL